jgi:acetyl esterase/lipase
MTTLWRSRQIATALAAVAVLAACEVTDPLPVDRLSGVAASTMTPLYDDVPYGLMPGQQLDMYAPGSNKNGGIIVWLHGGGWTGGSSTEISPVAHALVKRGWTLLSVDYRNAIQAPFPAALEDTKLAIRWAKVHGKQHGLNPKKVFVMGWSAGGHLAALAATTEGVFEPTSMPLDLEGVSSRPTGAIALNAPLDPMTFAATGAWDVTSNRGATSRLLGCVDDVSIDGCPMTGDMVTPATFADPGDAPIYIAAGDLDPITDLQTQALDPSEVLTSAMGANKVWIDVVDTGAAEDRAHSIDRGMNFWAMEQFLKWAPRL